MNPLTAPVNHSLSNRWFVMNNEVALLMNDE